MKRPLSTRLYALGLHALPGDLRRTHGDEMLEAFERTRDSLGSAGGVRRPRYVVSSLVDLLRLAVAERWRRRAERYPLELGQRWRAVRASRSDDGSWVSDLRDDLRLAVRGLARTPRQTVVLVTTLALGIGANTAIFSVLHGVLLQPLPYDQPDRLALVSQYGSESGPRSGLAGSDLLDLQADVAAFGSAAGFTSMSTNLGGRNEPVVLAWVTPGFFDVFGVAAAQGRLLDRNDYTPTRQDLLTRDGYEPRPVAAVIASALFEAAFGSDPSLLGREIEVNGQRMRVVGVLPDGFRVHLPPDSRLPTAVDVFTSVPSELARSGRATGGLWTFARLRDGTTLDDARRELESFSARLREAHPEHAAAGTRLAAADLHDEVVGHARSFLWLLFGAVALVLVIACANVAGLLLVRTSARRREFALRAALGGAGGRIVRHLLAEGFVISFLGVGTGLALAWWGVDGLLALRPDGLPRAEAIQMDGWVFLFSAVTCVLAAIFFGIAPASAAQPRAPRAALDDSPGSPGNVRLRSALIVAQLALSLVLLTGTGLLVRSVERLNRVEPGFEPQGAHTVNVSLPFFAYRDREARVGLYRAITAEARALPGVTAAGAAASLPLSSGGPMTARYAVAGAEHEWDERVVDYRPVSPGYVEAMGMTILTGRTFTDADERPEAAPVVVIDDLLAAEAFPEGHAVGQELLVPAHGEAGSQRSVWARVVGIVDRVRREDLTRDGRPAVYVPGALYSWFEMSFVLRTEKPLREVIEPLRERVAGIDPSVPLFGARPLGDYVAAATAERRLALILIGLFAAVALVLASVGLYGVVATAVELRTSELGMRLALGARRPDIVALVLAKGMRLTGLGIALGLVGAAALTRPLSSLLFEVEPTDPPTWIATATALGFVALAASWIPARRATRIDPVDALRAE